MPYITEDITCYVFGFITEYHESLDKFEIRDNKKSIEEIVYNNHRANLKTLCAEFLSSDINTSSSLFQAVLNSINLDNLNDYLRDWLADCDSDSSDESEETEEKCIEADS